jgi:hypothetical protein
MVRHCAAGALTSYPDFGRLLPLSERLETRWYLGGVVTLQLCGILVLWQDDYDKRLFYRPRTGTPCENISCVACCS